MNNQHHFEVDIAKKHGLEAAVILNLITVWVRKNEADGEHFRDGRYWTYNSGVRTLKNHWPYLSTATIKRNLDKLEKAGLILKSADPEHPQRLTYSTNIEPLQNETGKKPVQNEPDPLQNGPDPYQDETVSRSIISNKSKKKSNIVSWRYDFSLYQKECRDSVTAILKDADKMKELSELLKAKFGEGWSTYQTLRKAFRTYWYTRDGWEKKKSSRAKKIDWFKTCRNIVKQDWNLERKASADDGTMGDILVG